MILDQWLSNTIEITAPVTSSFTSRRTTFISHTNKMAVGGIRDRLPRREGDRLLLGGNKPRVSESGGNNGGVALVNRQSLHLGLN